jgi:hypothetical protein
MTHDTSKPELQTDTDADGNFSITISGELNVKHHAALHAMLRDISTPAPSIHVAISPAAIDLCFLQLLHSFTKSAAQQGKTIQLNATLSEADEKLLVRTGFHTLLHFSSNS